MNELLNSIEIASAFIPSKRAGFTINESKIHSKLHTDLHSTQIYVDKERRENYNLSMRLKSLNSMDTIVSSIESKLESISVPLFKRLRLQEDEPEIKINDSPHLKQPQQVQHPQQSKQQSKQIKNQSKNHHPNISSIENTTQSAQISIQTRSRTNPDNFCQLHPTLYTLLSYKQFQNQEYLALQRTLLQISRESDIRNNRYMKAIKLMLDPQSRKELDRVISIEHPESVIETICNLLGG